MSNLAKNNYYFLTAAEVYSHIGDISMVQSLKSLKYIEDKNLIAGHICKFLGNFDRAQVCTTT